MDKLVSADEKQRLNDSIEIALEGILRLVRVEPPAIRTRALCISEHHACPKCGLSLPEIEPRLFPSIRRTEPRVTCDGPGAAITNVDEDRIIPDPTKSIEGGAIIAWSDPSRRGPTAGRNRGPATTPEILSRSATDQFKIPMDKPWNKLSEKHREIILNGGGTYTPSWAKNPQEFEGRDQEPSSAA